MGEPFPEENVCTDGYSTPYNLGRNFDEDEILLHVREETKSKIYWKLLEFL